MDSNSIGKQQIIKLLPHREPMLLIDELINIVPLKSAVGIVNVKKTSFFVQGHFPGQPVMIVIFHHHQGVARQKIVGIANLTVSGQVGRAAYRGDLLVGEDRLGIEAGGIDLVRDVIVDAEVELGEVQAVRVLDRQDADLDMRMRTLERLRR